MMKTNCGLCLVCLLVCVQYLPAQIQCFFLSNTIDLTRTGPTQTFDLDIRGDGDVDFTFRFLGNPPPQPYYEFFLEPYANNTIAICGDMFCPNICYLEDCDPVATTGSFENVNGYLVEDSPNSCFGFFYDQVGYIAFTDNGAEGWLAISIPYIDNDSVRFIIHAYGIETPGNTQPVFANKCSALPVELIGFNAHIQDDFFLFQWEVGQEIDLEFYELQMSLDAEYFIPKDKIMASSLPSYDLSILASPYLLTYWRLKMVDIDGSYSYSDVLSLKKGGDWQLINTLTQQNLFFNQPTRQVSQVYGNSGRLWLEVAEGDEMLDVSGLPVGSYWINHQGIIHRFIKY